MRATWFRSLSAVLCGLLVVVLVSSVLAQDGREGRRGRRGGLGGGPMGGGPMGGGPMGGGPMGGGPMGGGPMGGRMGGEMGMLMLLPIEQVQKEVKLTDEQKAELKKIGDSMMEEGRKAMDKAMEEGRKATEGKDREEVRKWWQDNREKLQKEMTERGKSVAEQIKQILKPEQVTRLKQIEMQVAGVQVLRRDEVQQQLGLTEDQKKELQKIAEEVRSQMQQSFRPPREGDGEGERPSREEWRKRMEEMRQKMEKMREEVEKKCMAVLTTEQKTKLGQMMGEPFELDRAALRRGTGPWGGRGGEGRRGEGRRGGGRRGGAPRGDEQGPPPPDGPREQI
jgi:hypothetical protein